MQQLLLEAPILINNRQKISLDVTEKTPRHVPENMLEMTMCVQFVCLSLRTNETALIINGENVVINNVQVFVYAMC